MCVVCASDSMTLSGHQSRVNREQCLRRVHWQTCAWAPVQRKECHGAGRQRPGRLVPDWRRSHGRRPGRVAAVLTHVSGAVATTPPLTDLSGYAACKEVDSIHDCMMTIGRLRIHTVCHTLQTARALLRTGSVHILML